MGISLVDRLHAFFAARPGQWIDGERLAQVAGKYAWRSRCSDLRKPPYRLVIENRQRMMVGETGRRWKCSEYRYVPSSTQTAEFQSQPAVRPGPEA
jgi:hypothetical protein